MDKNIKQKSLIKNVIYNFLYTGLNLLFPLITAPYVSRILGASNLGKVNLASVVVNWFVLFAIFGTSTYGIREIAKIRDDKDALSKTFSEIVAINGILSLVVAVIYYVVIFNVENFYSELPLYIIMSLTIILNMFDIDWFYQGIEEYRYITIRSSIFKLISLICIFLFVTKQDNYVIYGLISVMATSLSRLLNYIYSRRYVEMRLIDIDIRRHFKRLSIFFLHTFVVTIYTSLDQVLLGFMVDTRAVAFMTRSKVVTSTAIAISTTISNVTMPRASYYKDTCEEKFRALMSEVPKYILLITIPMTVGCLCLADSIMYILGGSEFLQAGNLLMVMAPIIILSPLSGYLQYQVLVASGKEKLGLKCAVVTSFVSVGLNAVLITTMGFFGAGIVQTLAEFTAVSLRYYIAKRVLKYKEIRFINKASIAYSVASLIMGAVVLLIRILISDLVVSFMVSAVVGASVYIAVLLIAREKLVTFMLGQIKTRMKISWGE